MGNPANTVNGTYTATWKSTSLGGVDKVNWNLTLLGRPVKIGSVGLFALDWKFEGLDFPSTVQLELKEITEPNLRLLSPWESVSNAQVGAVPAVGAGLLQYTGQLVLHPTEMGAATDMDIIIPKAVPHPQDVAARNRDPNAAGVDIWPVRFVMLPDMAEAALNRRWFHVKGT